MTDKTRDIKVELELARKGDANAVEKTAKEIEDLGPAGDKAARGLDRLEKEVRDVAAENRKTAKTIDEMERELDQVRSALKKARSELDRFKKSGKGLGKVKKSFSDLQKTLVAGLGLSTAKQLLDDLIGTIADFEQAMANVRAITGANDEQFARLNETAQKLGRTTIFSATEAANALEELSRAGLDVDEAIGAVPATLNLAAAGALGLGRSADIATNVMSGFGLTVAELPRIIDVMAKTAASSNTSVGLMGESMKIVAPIAASLGISVETTAAAVGTLGNAGIKGTEAGNALKRIFANLIDVTPKAERAIQSLGLTIDDLNPTTVSFEEIIRRLSEAGLGAKEAFQIFGKIAAPAVSALVSQKDGLAELSTSLNDVTGASEEMARVMQDNLQGSIKRLQSVAESVQLQIGEGGLTSSLRKAIGELAMFGEQSAETAKLIGQTLGSLTTIISGIVKSIRAGFKSIAAVIGLSAAQIAEKVLAINKVFFSLASNVPGLEQFADLVQEKLGFVEVVIDEFKSNITRSTADTLRGTREGLASDLDQVVDLWTDAANRSSEAARRGTEKASEGISENLQGLLEQAEQLARGLERALELNPNIDLENLRVGVGDAVRELADEIEREGGRVPESLLNIASKLDILPTTAKQKLDEFKVALEGFELDPEDLVAQAEDFANRLEAALEMDPKLDVGPYKAQIEAFLQALSEADEAAPAALEQIAAKLGVLPESFAATFSQTKENVSSFQNDLRSLLLEIPGFIDESAASLREKESVLKAALEKVFDGVQGINLLKPEQKEALKAQIEEVVRLAGQLGEKVDPVIAAHAGNLGVLIDRYTQTATSVEDAMARIQDATNETADEMDAASLAQQESISVVVNALGEYGKEAVIQKTVTKEMALAMKLSELDEADPKIRAYVLAVKDAQKQLEATGGTADQAATEMKKPADQAGEAGSKVGELASASRDLADASKDAGSSLNAQADAISRIAESARTENISGLRGELELLSETRFADPIVNQFDEIIGKADEAFQAIQKLNRAGQDGGAPTPEPAAPTPAEVTV